MKETWLFGKLNTLGEDESDVKRREELERDADAIQKAIEEGGLLKPAKWSSWWHLSIGVFLGLGSGVVL